MTKNDIATCENIQKIAMGQGDDYTTGFLLDLIINSNENEKLLTIDLSKKQVVNLDPKVLQWINLTENLEQPGNKKMLFIIDEVKDTILDFSKGTLKVL